MCPEDVGAVYKIERECFSQPWSEQGFRDTIGKEYAVFLVAKKQRQILGYGGMYCAADEGEITNIAVDIGSRRARIGSLLLEALLKQAEKRNLLHIVLEVRKSNQAAISLYERYGFKIEGIRKGFYEKPKEDAYIMLWKERGGKLC